MPEVALFPYEDPKSEERLLKLVLVVWYDAYDDRETIALKTARTQLERGMPLITAGILVEDNEDTLVLAQDLITPYSMVRGMRSIPKTGIEAIWTLDANWTTSEKILDDILVDSAPYLTQTAMEAIEKKGVKV